MPLLPASKAIADLEFDKKAESFQSVLPNQYLYPTIQTSAGASLRASSEGACYHQVRMAFYSYSHVTQAVGLTLVAVLHPPEGGLQPAKE